MYTDDNSRIDTRQNGKTPLRQTALGHCRPGRVVPAIAELEHGNIAVLRDDGLLGALPDYFALLAVENGEDRALQLLRRLGEATVLADEPLRLKAVLVLAMTTDRIAAVENDLLLRELADILSIWLRLEKKFIAGYEIACWQLHTICGRMLRSGLLAEADKVLSTLHDIWSGRLHKIDAMRKVAGGTLDRIASHGLLVKLFGRFMSRQNQNRQLLSHILTRLGRKPAAFALDLLERTDDPGERQRLLQFLISAGTSTRQVVAGRLPGEERWNSCCDMLQILAGMGDDGVYPLVALKLQHADLRVRREAVDSIVRLGGDKLVDRLSEIVFTVDDVLKNVIVKHLGASPRPTVCTALLRLIETKAGQRDFADDLLLCSIVTALQSYPETGVVIRLRLLREQVQESAGSNRLLHLLDDTLLTLESQIRHRRYLPSEGRPVLVVADGGAPPLPVDMPVRVDPGTNGLTGPRPGLQLWEPLWRRLGDEGFAALYKILQFARYEDNAVIAREGQCDDNLYFISSGSVSLECTTGLARTFLQRLQPGMVVGAEPFFAITVWTVEARARTGVEVYILRRRALQQLELHHAGISARLQGFCTDFTATTKLLQASGADRRGERRHPVTAIIRTALIDSRGRVSPRRFVCRLRNISKGGFCYDIGITDHEHARLLLGRQVQFRQQLAEDVVCTVEGIVVGIEQVQDEAKTFRIHVRMLEPISSRDVHRVVGRFS
ncbi:MAG: cyclic nucleotide-binding domain-containing protein [Desulfopila sp.]